MSYLVLDLETASAASSSICQIGIVEVRDGEVAGVQDLLIDPRCSFHPWNVRIHGIRPERVAGQPTFPDRYEALRARLDGRIVVTHGPFDRVAIARACEEHGLPAVEALWLDNQRVVRRTWAEFAKGGYNLKNLARRFGIRFRHHDALEDALATAHVFRRALDESGLTAGEWHAALAAEDAARGAPRRRRRGRPRRSQGVTAPAQAG